MGPLYYTLMLYLLLHFQQLNLKQDIKYTKGKAKKNHINFFGCIGMSWLCTPGNLIHLDYWSAM